MTPTPTGPAAPAYPDATQDETDDGALDHGYTVCLDCLPDGTYRVRMEPLESEASEGQDARTAEPEGQTVPSFEAALLLVTKLHQAHPMGPDTEQAHFEAASRPETAT